MKDACNATPHTLLRNCSHQSAPKVEPMVGENVNTALRRENEDLKSKPSKVNTILTNTMERMEEMENKYRKVLHKDGSEREIQLKQEILVLETSVRF